MWGGVERSQGTEKRNALARRALPVLSGNKDAGTLEGPAIVFVERCWIYVGSLGHPASLGLGNISYINYCTTGLCFYDFNCCVSESSS